MSQEERIHHIDPNAFAQMAPVRMTATGHLEAEDDEGNCEYKWRLTGITEDRFQHLVTQMKFRVGEGHGRCIYEVGVADDGAAIGLCDDDYAESVSTVNRMAETLGFQVKLAYERVLWSDRDESCFPKDTYAKGSRAAGARIRTSPSLDPLVPSAADARGIRRRCAEIHVTRKQRQVEDLRIAFCGLGGSGKSTLVGVLTQGTLDDGCGSVRSTIFNHKHEVDTGHTSSVAHHVMGFDAVGKVTNYDETHAVIVRSPILSPTLSSGAATILMARQLQALSDGAAPETLTEGVSTIDYALNATRTIAERSVKLVTLLDLGGNDRFSKTAYFGMTSKAPGYACIVVAADSSVVEGMSLHVSICLAMQIPFCIVITKCDSVGELELDDLQLEIDDYIRSEGKHLNLAVRTHTFGSYEDALDEKLVQECVSVATIPVFLTSSVDGRGVGYVKTFFNKLPAVAAPPTRVPAEVLIDGCFNVPGTGPVLSGFVSKGTVHEGQSLLMGPDRYGHFQPITVMGIHEKGSHVSYVCAGTDATLSVAHIPQTIDANRKGTIILGMGTVHPHVCMTFECRVKSVGDHTAPVVAGQEPIVHCRNIRQAVRLLAVGQGERLSPVEEEQDQLVSPVERETRQIQPKGEGVVLCRFMYHPEIVEKGCTVLMRWNRHVRLVGTVTRLVEVTPCTSPRMRPTPTDAFEPAELMSQLLLEEAAAITKRTEPVEDAVSLPPVTCEGSRRTSDVLNGNGLDYNDVSMDTLGLAGGDLFGSDSDDCNCGRGHLKSQYGLKKDLLACVPRAATHGQSNSPSSEASSNEAMDGFGNAVAKLYGQGGVRLAPCDSNSPTDTHGDTVRDGAGTERASPEEDAQQHDEWNHAALTNESSRTPEMKPFGTAEFASDNSML